MTSPPTAKGSMFSKASVEPFGLAKVTLPEPLAPSVALLAAGRLNRRWCPWPPNPPSIVPLSLPAAAIVNVSVLPSAPFRFSVLEKFTSTRAPLTLPAFVAAQRPGSVGGAIEHHLVAAAGAIERDGRHERVGAERILVDVQRVVAGSRRLSKCC